MSILKANVIEVVGPLKQECDVKRIHISQYKDEYKGLLRCLEGHHLVAKRGTKKQHHFSHSKPLPDGSTCSDLYGNNKGEWHMAMQDRIIPRCLEIGMRDMNGKGRYVHIADALCNGNVIEFQNSPISSTKIEDREKFYVGEMGYKMCWVFEAGNKKIDIVPLGQEGDLICYQWRMGPKYMLDGGSRGVKVFLDTGNMDFLEIVATNKKKTKIVVRIHRSFEFDKQWIGEENLAKGPEALNDRDHLPNIKRGKVLQPIEVSKFISQWLK